LLSRQSPSRVSSRVSLLHGEIAEGKIRPMDNLVVQMT
jgi:hypothetical protein